MSDTQAPASTAQSMEAVEQGSELNNTARSPAPGAAGTTEQTTPGADSTNDEKKAARDKRKDLPIRQYLDNTVVPVLLAGMSQLTKERPDEDEVEWLAHWMLRNNPNKKQKSDA